MIRTLRDEVLLILQGRGAILDVARDVTRVLHETGSAAMLVGGVAVVLPGHVRTPMKLGVLVKAPKPAG